MYIYVVSALLSLFEGGKNLTNSKQKVTVWLSDSLIYMQGIMYIDNQCQTRIWYDIYYVSIQINPKCTQTSECIVVYYNFPWIIDNRDKYK